MPLGWVADAVVGVPGAGKKLLTLRLQAAWRLLTDYLQAPSKMYTGYQRRPGCLRLDLGLGMARLRHVGRTC